jgi:hypothetical protein
MAEIFDELGKATVRAISETRRRCYFAVSGMRLGLLDRYLAKAGYTGEKNCLFEAMACNPEGAIL